MRRPATATGPHVPRQSNRVIHAGTPETTRRTHPLAVSAIGPDRRVCSASALDTTSSDRGVPPTAQLDSAPRPGAAIVSLFPLQKGSQSPQARGRCDSCRRRGALATAPRSAGQNSVMSSGVPRQLSIAVSALRCPRAADCSSPQIESHEILPAYLTTVPSLQFPYCTSDYINTCDTRGDPALRCSSA